MNDLNPVPIQFLYSVICKKKKKHKKYQHLERQKFFTSRPVGRKNLGELGVHMSLY